MAVFTEIFVWFLSACNRNYTGNSGVLTSPGYPGLYPHNVDCLSTVRADVGSTLAFYFNSFSVEPHSNCYYDYLRVWISCTVFVFFLRFLAEWFVLVYKMVCLFFEIVFPCLQSCLSLFTKSFVCLSFDKSLKYS